MLFAILLAVSLLLLVVAGIIAYSQIGYALSHSHLGELLFGIIWFVFSASALLIVNIHGYRHISAADSPLYLLTLILLVYLARFFLDLADHRDFISARIELHRRRRAEAVLQRQSRLIAH